VGIYTLRVRARRLHHRGLATVRLVVAKPPSEPAAPNPPETVSAPDAFEISGSLPVALTPGTGQPLDLTLLSRESSDLSITGLDVRLASVSASRPGSALDCSASDFSVEQFSGAPGFTLHAGSRASLGELGFGPAEWPQVAMRDLPVNQDGCKGASLTLEFSGFAARESP
jgi:hypothetical protein